MQAKACVKRVRLIENFSAPEGISMAPLTENFRFQVGDDGAIYR
jgi:hypothetical protein